MELNKQKKLLKILAVIFFVSLIYRLMNPFEQQQVERLTYTGKTGENAAASAEKPKSSVSPISDVMISLLENPPEHSGDVISEHFFQQIPGMEAPKPQPETANSGNELDFEDENLDEQHRSRDPKTVMLDRIGRLKVIGMFVQKKKRAVFFQRGKQTLVVREGDRIDGQFLVEKITTDKITLYAKKIDERIHIDLKSYLAPHERLQLMKGNKQ